LEYFDGGTYLPFESFVNVPASLTTVGPFAADSIISVSQLNGFKVRMRGVSTTGGADNITYFVDAIELRIQIDIPVVNQPPELDPIGPKSTTEGVQLTFGVSATDAESVPTLTTSTLPGSANFIDNGDATGDFVWKP